MNSALKKIFVMAIDKKWTKGAKDMIMGYANKSFVELLEQMYVQYGQITPVFLMSNQEEMQATYNVEDTIYILFDQI